MDSVLDDISAMSMISATSFRAVASFREYRGLQLSLWILSERGIDLLVTFLGCRLLPLFDGRLMSNEIKVVILGIIRELVEGIRVLYPRIGALFVSFSGHGWPSSSSSPWSPGSPMTSFFLLFILLCGWPGLSLKWRVQRARINPRPHPTACTRWS